MDFSVLMSVYKNDTPEHVGKALESVINQSKPPKEIIVVIDGPIDSKLQNTVNSYAAKYKIFKVVPLKNNVGLGNALRIGMQHCSYELIARMDSDDISVPNRFEKQIQCFEEDRELSLVGGYIREFDNDTNKVLSIREVPLEHSEIEVYLKSRCPFNHMTVMFKKSEVILAGGYLDWHYNEDYYLWIRMYLANCKFKNIPEVLVNVRASEGLYMRRGGKRYFQSEKDIHRYMLDQRVINIPRYCLNIVLRWIVQVGISNNIRRILYLKLFRKQALD
jgi:glycosyltransferase involved in cell wall biosynthesis